MIRLTIALLVCLALAPSATAIAGPPKVLVLPLDGDAAPDVRARYSASVQRLARGLGGKLTAGDVTFTDTATAIGCDPKAPQCGEDVRATLGVDELVYGTVSRQGGKLVLVVHRVGGGKPRRDVTATLDAADPPERADPELSPLFRPSGGAEAGAGSNGGGTGTGTGAGGPGESPTGGGAPGPGGSAENPNGPQPASPLSRNKVLGYAAIGGGATLLLISFALWSSASGVQDDIAAYPVTTYENFVALRALEDTARSRAWTGNALFVAGLAAGGLGGWILYREHKAQQTVVTPAPVPGGAALLLGGVF